MGNFPGIVLNMDEINEKKVIDWMKDLPSEKLEKTAFETDGHWGCGTSFGSGMESGYGYGSGTGAGTGFEDGTGNSISCAYNQGISSFCRKKVYQIDGASVIISFIKGDYAKGSLLRLDLSMIPCYILKSQSSYAIGLTLDEAKKTLMEKLSILSADTVYPAAFTASYKKRSL